MYMCVSVKVNGICNLKVYVCLRRLSGVMIVKRIEQVSNLGMRYISEIIIIIIRELDIFRSIMRRQPFVRLKSI